MFVVEFHYLLYQGDISREKAPSPFPNAGENGTMALSIFTFSDFSERDSHIIAKGARVMD